MERREDDHIFVTLLGRDEVKPSGTKQSECQVKEVKRKSTSMEVRGWQTEVPRRLVGGSGMEKTLKNRISVSEKMWQAGAGVVKKKKKRTS